MSNKFLTAVILVASLASCKKSDYFNQTALELVFADSTYQLTGVAVSEEGRLFTNYPLWSPVYKYALVEILPGNDVRPYPDAHWNSWKPGDNGENKWVCVQAVYIDDANAMWVVDPAAPKMEQVYQNSYKLVKINMGKNNIEKIYQFDGVLSDKSYINDVRVDTENGFAYLTNSNEGGILVVDLATGKSRQVLQNHYSVKTDPHFTFIIDGKELKKNEKPLKVNSDGIALSPDRQWLYYHALTDDKLYRIETAYLRDATLEEDSLEARVQDLGHFAATDGMIFDKKGNLYLGDPRTYSILQISPDLKMKTVLKDKRLIWPDSYSLSSDGNYLYISCSQIHKQPEYNNGVNKRTSPYTIYKMKLPS